MRLKHRLDARLNRHGLVILDSPEQLKRQRQLKRDAQSFHIEQVSRRIQLRTAGSRRQSTLNTSAPSGLNNGKDQ